MVDSKETRRQKMKLMQYLEGQPGYKTMLKVFTQMESSIKICFEEIKNAKKRWPKQEDLLQSSFSLLRPETVFSGKEEIVYRNHCREILERAAKGLDTRPGTRAEVLIALSEMTLVTPLRQDYTILFSDLFTKVMEKKIGGDPGSETYPGAVDEIYSKLQKWLTAEWRKL